MSGSYTCAYIGGSFVNGIRAVWNNQTQYCCPTFLCYCCCLSQDRIEDIKEKQLEEAECTVRTQFAMEQILYCQDKVYSQDLSLVREQVAAEGKHPLKGDSVSFELGARPDEKHASIKEMAYHLEAYFNVSNSCFLPKAGALYSGWFLNTCRYLICIRGVKQPASRAPVWPKSN